MTAPDAGLAKRSGEWETGYRQALYDVLKMGAEHPVTYEEIYAMLDATRGRWIESMGVRCDLCKPADTETKL